MRAAACRSSDGMALAITSTFAARKERRGGHHT
jgi:hypothetical protein